MYPWGDEDPNCSRLNYNYCVGDTTAVGSYPGDISPYGLMDMGGNVIEWVNDWYGSNYYDVAPYSNPQGPSSGTDKVLRGGAWHNDVNNIRVADRGENPTATSYYIGFRCVGTTPWQ